MLGLADIRDWLKQLDSKTIEDIKSAFLSDNKQINIDVISDINPEYEFEVEDPFKIIEIATKINIIPINH